MRAFLTIFLLVTQVYAQSFVSQTLVEGLKNFNTLAVQPDGIVIITGKRMSDTLDGSFIRIDQKNRVKRPVRYQIITEDSYIWEQWLWHPDKKGLAYIKSTRSGAYPFHLATSLTCFSKGLKNVRIQKKYRLLLVTPKRHPVVQLILSHWNLVSIMWAGCLVG